MILVCVRVKVCLLVLESKKQSLHADKKNILIQRFGFNIVGEDIGQQIPERLALWGILVGVVDGARREIVRQRFLKGWTSRYLECSELDTWYLGRREKICGFAYGLSVRIGVPVRRAALWLYCG